MQHSQENRHAKVSLLIKLQASGLHFYQKKRLWDRCARANFVKPWFFCDFWYYHMSRLAWKFNWNSSSRSEKMKNFSVDISYFQRFSSIFWIFWYFLITKKLMTSSYNKLCHHFFTFNILYSFCQLFLSNFYFFAKR